jgi:enoyl-CoA hydratase/carnithine racemase
MVAHIEGNCMGAGVEIASCCDIRLASTEARFGAPIAKLGFPMAPREAALVAREVGLMTARQMLLEATLFTAQEMQARGFISRVLEPTALGAEVIATAQRIVRLAPLAARANKQIIREMITLSEDVYKNKNLPKLLLLSENNPYVYAPGTEHREGIEAFLGKRKPCF